MKPSEFKISIPVESYDEKTNENYRNCYASEKRIRDIDSKFFIAQIEDFNKDCVKISRRYILYTNREIKFITRLVPNVFQRKPSSSFK